MSREIATAPVILLTCVLVPLLLLSFGSCDVHHAGMGVVPREQSCGPKCVWIASNLLGKPLRWVDVADHFRDGTYEGTTISQLQVAASRFGLTTKLCKSDWCRLQKRKGIAILFLSAGHFVAVDSRRTHAASEASEVLYVHDPDRHARWYTQNELDDIWDGTCMLMSADVQCRANGATAAFNHCYFDVGLVKNKGAVEHRFSITNEGTEPLSVRMIGTSCGCAHARLSKELIAPRGSGHVDVTIEPKAKGGRFCEEVIIQTSDPQSKYVSLTFCGSTPRDRLLSTTRAYLGRIVAGNARDYSIAFYNPTDRALTISQIDAKLVEPYVDGYPMPSCEVSVRDFTTADVQTRAEYSLCHGDLLLDVKVFVPIACTSKTFKFACEVHTNAPECRIASVLVEGNIAPDLASRPAVIRIERRTGDKIAKASVEVYSQGSHPLGKLDVLGPSNMPNKITVTGGNNSSTLVISIPTHGLNSGIHDGVVHCQANDRRELDIPIFVFDLCENDRGK